MSTDAVRYQAEATTPRRLPAMAGLVAMVALLAGGGWYGYQRIAGTSGIPMADASDFVPDGYGQRTFRQRPQAGPGVTVLPNVIRVNAGGGASMTALARNNAWRLSFNGIKGAAADAKSIELLLQTRRLLDSRRQQTELKLTDAQRTALAAIPDHPPELSAEQAKQAIALLDPLKKLGPTDAAGQPMKNELVTIVTAAAQRDRAAVIAEYNARAQQVRKTLSSEQLRLLAGGTPPPRAASRPAK